VSIPELPPYTVRERARARRVVLRVTPRRGLTVVVPKGFPAGRVPGIVAGRLEWVRAALARLEAEGLAPGRADLLPGHVRLRTPGERTFLVHYVPGKERPILRQNGADLLVLSGPVGPGEARLLLSEWLRRQGRALLPPLVEEASQAHGLAGAGVQVRLQSARWGSCSARGTLSLNAKLLFLPPRLARHVVLHELCHTRHLDHSPAFRTFLASLEPEAARLEAELKSAWRWVPPWID